MLPIILPSRRPSKQLCCLRGYVVVLILAVIGLGACAPPLETSSTATLANPTPPPTKPLSPTKLPPPADWPYRWLKGIPCRPPCWEGITPGQTTAAEAVEILDRSPVIATVEMTKSPLISEQGQVIWSWVGREGREGGWAAFHAQTPSSPIYAVYPYYSPASFRLGDVIQAYGEPSHIIAKAFPRPDREGVDYDLRLLYRSQGFVLGVGGSAKPVLNADILLERVSFFALNDEGFEAALGGVAGHPEWVVPWKGMKDYDYYCTDVEGKPCP